MDDTLTLDFLAGLQRTGIRPGLTRMRRLMARLGHPERAFRSVLITGTNGKGSTAAFLESILSSQGYRTGLFTSPHLVDVRERVRVAGRELDAARFRELGLEVRAAMAGGGTARPVRATYFEALSAIGFLAFAAERVEVAVVEVGMGGRLDSTNVIDPLVSVLTNVTLDHTHFLGGTEDAIAAEKVEVARRGRPFVTAVSDRLFDSVVGPRLAALGAPAIRLRRDFDYSRADGHIDWRGRTTGLDRAAVSLMGTFQGENAAIALAAAEALAGEGVPVRADAMRRGVGATVWPGRFDRVSDRPAVILDGCHNAGAAACLADTLDAYPQSRPLVMVHGSKPDKDFRGVLRALAPRCDAVIETTIPGLCDPDALVAVCRDVAPTVPVEAVADLATAFDRAAAIAGEGGTVLITGSLYLVGAAMTLQPWLTRSTAP
jgi:dihydrofolate synthase/folylpolyglutamate synthase